MAGELSSNLTNGKTWLRGLLIILFAVLYGVAEFIVWVLVVLQFGSQLITGEPMPRLLVFANGLNAYVYQILQFITYRSEVRPFPFSAWPTHGLDDVREEERAASEREAARRAAGEAGVVERVDR